MAGEQNIMVQTGTTLNALGRKTFIKQVLAKEITPQKRFCNVSANYRIPAYMSGRVSGIIISCSKYDGDICEKRTELISRREPKSGY